MIRAKVTGMFWVLPDAWFIGPTGLSVHRQASAQTKPEADVCRCVQICADEVSCPRFLCSLRKPAVTEDDKDGK